MRRVPQPRTTSKRRGAMLVLICAMMVVLLGMVAFAVDIGFVVTNKTQLQSAADAAALAGASTLVENATIGQTIASANSYSVTNAPGAHTTITVGNWDPTTLTFTPDNDAPNAVRAVVQRTEAKGNPAPSFFGKVFGHDHFDVKAESIAVGATYSVAYSNYYTTSVYVTSTKDLSNVVLQFSDGTHQKFEPLNGYSGTFTGTGQHAGKTVTGVWIKSGCYQSNDGPGYGEYIANPNDTTTVHGNIANKGCNAHVTATFGSTGVTFTESGTSSPVRLVH